jgi:hypothetical protein
LHQWDYQGIAVPALPQTPSTVLVDDLKLTVSANKAFKAQ